VKGTLSVFPGLMLGASLLIFGVGAGMGQVPKTTFQVVKTPNPNFNNGLNAISASSANDMWASGSAMMHYDGKKWTAFPTATINGNPTTLDGGVIDISPTLAWGAGEEAIPNEEPVQVIEQWNGTQWSEFPSPQFGQFDQAHFFAMAATSDNDVWAVGDLLNNGGQNLNFLFEHWDGSAWTATSFLVNDSFLLGISADATNDAWAVGFQGPENDSSQTLVVHWDGKNWNSVVTPNVGSGANQLNAVQALSPTDVWAVGFSTSVPPPQQEATLTLIEHFDGKTWSVVPSPNKGPKSIYESNRLYGVTAVSSTDVWAFGSYSLADGSGQQHTLLEHWDGKKWTIVASPNPHTDSSFTSDILVAGTLASSGNLWIVGDEDEPPNGGSLAIHTTAP
jgi:hypothetical protein